jgi:ribosomal protein S18 acetylase RimI-like enzyme
MEKILQANADDADVLAQLVNAAYRGDSGRQGWTTEADLIDGTRTDAELLQNIMATPGQMILKYVLDDQVQGCVELHVEGDKLYLGMLTVNPLMQNKGIGKKLLRAAEDVAHQHSCKKIEMNVLTQRQELINWYVRHGYEVTNQRKPFAYTDPRLGQPKTKLEFVVLARQL